MPPASLLTLDPGAAAIVGECLFAAADGPFFPEWEFQTLFGVDRALVRTVCAAWPQQTVTSEELMCAVIGSMNNLLGYPHGQEEAWSLYISVPPGRVRQVLEEMVIRLLDV